MDDLRLIAPVTDAASQGLGEAKAALTFLRWTAGRSKGSRLSSVMTGVAFSLFGEENVSTADSYPVATAYAASTTPKSDSQGIIRAISVSRNGE